MIGIRKVMFAAAATLAASGAALAADLPTMKSAPAFAPLPAPYNWSGLYVGVYGGGAIGPWTESDIPYPDFTNGSALTASGPTFGGLVGYNLQFGPLVVGAEGEFGYDGIQGKVDWWAGNSSNHNQTKWSSDYIGRVRARAGVAFDRLLLYVAGGASFADYRTTFATLSCSGACSNSWSGSYTGYNVGLGAEYAFTQNVIGRLEYIYDGFPSETIIAPPSTWDNRKISYDQNTVRAALEFKF